MSVRVRHVKKDVWQVDVMYRLPNGRRTRERRRVHLSTKSAAKRWGERREQHVLIHGPKPPIVKEVPTLKHFAPRFMDGYVRANRQKPSTIAAKEMILRVYLIPALGHKRLDAITNEDVQRLKKSLVAKAAKTVNNVLSVLSRMLNVAVDWDVIDRKPCVVRLLSIPKSSAGFHDFDAYERLVTAAHDDGQTRLLVLLGGEAGLRSGEMIALEWADVDFANGRLRVERSDWNGQVTVPKNSRFRSVPLTDRLAEALREHRHQQHLRNRRVLCHADGEPFTRQYVQSRMRSVSQRAGVRKGVHILRHTFCSHLAMRGAPAASIQALAGHQDLSTTQRYMHVSQGALDDAIHLLNKRGNQRGTALSSI